MLLGTWHMDVLQGADDWLATSGIFSMFNHEHMGDTSDKTDK
jgi:hypothetical protein